MVKIDAHIRGREDIGNRHKIFIELDVMDDPDDPRSDEQLGRDLQGAIYAAFVAARGKAK